jgi:hypothetical protein
VSKLSFWWVWTWFRWNGLGLLIVAGAVSAYVAPVFRTARNDSPIVSTTTVIGKIVGVRAGPSNPKAASGAGFGYLYIVQLNGTFQQAYVWDDTRSPHLIGSIILLDRIEQENGIVAYRFRPADAERTKRPAELRQYRPSQDANPLTPVGTGTP